MGVSSEEPTDSRKFSKDASLELVNISKTPVLGEDCGLGVCGRCKYM